MDKILKIQTEIGVLSKTETNPFFNSKYFDVNQIIAQLLPLLEKYGITVMQPLSEINGKPAIKTVLCETYSQGEEKIEHCILEEKIPLPDLQDPQKMGSAITYYRRYALQSLFLLQAQDDDANFANKGEKVIQTEPTYTKPMNKKDYADLNAKAMKAEADGEEPFN